MHLRADVGGDGQLLDLDLAASERPRHGPRRRSSLAGRASCEQRRRRPCPRPSAVARAVAGQTHRRRSTLAGACAADICGAPPHWRRCRRACRLRYCAGSLPAACAISSTMLSTAQKVQPGATDRNCPDGVALCAISLRSGADVVIGHGIEEVRAVHGEGVKRAFLVDRRRQESRDTPALGRPRADHVMVHARPACRRRRARP